MAKKRNNLISILNKPNKLVVGLVVFSTLISVLIIENSTLVAGVAIIQAIFIKLTAELILGRFKKGRSSAKRRSRTTSLNTRDVKIALASVDKKMNRILKKATPFKGAGHKKKTKRIKLIIMDFED